MLCLYARRYNNTASFAHTVQSHERTCLLPAFLGGNPSTNNKATRVGQGLVVLHSFHLLCLRHDWLVCFQDAEKGLYTPAQLQSMLCASFEAKLLPWKPIKAYEEFEKHHLAGDSGLILVPRLWSPLKRWNTRLAAKLAITIPKRQWDATSSLRRGSLAIGSHSRKNGLISNQMCPMRGERDRCLRLGSRPITMFRSIRLEQGCPQYYDMTPQTETRRRNNNREMLTNFVL